MTGGFYWLAARGACIRAVASACALALLGAAASGQTLEQAWQRAADAEPTLQAARATHRAAAERANQARAALLPQVELSYQRNKNHRDYVQGEPPGPGVEERYPARSAQLNITQSLWRPAQTRALDQARRAEEQAALQALAAEQDLLVKFMGAWFDVMAARDNVQHAQAQVEATAQQLQVMQGGLALGTHSDVQASEARARHGQAVAEHAAAEAEHDAKLGLLEQWTGPLPGFTPPALAGPVAALTAPPLPPLEGWLARIADANPTVLAAERGWQAAREEVAKQRALHQPTLDLVANRAHQLQGSGNFPGQAGYRSRQDTFGIQLNVPLYSGGGTQAKVREALAMAEKAQHDLEAARRNVVAQATQAWSLARAAAARRQAAEHALRAAQTALRAARTGQATGLKTPLDELQAGQQLAEARRDHQRARYDEMVAQARLHGAAGTLDASFVAEVSALLSPAAATATASQGPGR